MAQDGQRASPLVEKADRYSGQLLVFYAISFEVWTCVNQNRPR